MAWESIFAESFEFVKQYFAELSEHKKSECIAPVERAILTGLEKLPFPVKIIDVSVDNQKYPRLKDEICQLIYYDLSKIGKKQVDYCGKTSSKKDDSVIFLAECFGISKDDSQCIIDSMDDLNKNSEWLGFPLSDKLYIQFTSYNIKCHIERFHNDFRFLFTDTFNDYFASQYNLEEKTDFNSRYKLKPDAILPPLDLLVRDPRTSCSLEALQDSLADIQLIPKVPDPVKHEFQRAKDLFVFSYFKYDFITLSIRSGVFAYETAMKLRYVKSLGKKAVIKCNHRIIREITNPSYFEISDFLYEIKKEKNLKGVLVNDQKFPFNMKWIMCWLIKNGSPEWKFQSYDAVIKIRNNLAHPERKMILLPSSVSMLKNMAYDINEMFEK